METFTVGSVYTYKLRREVQHLPELCLALAQCRYEFLMHRHINLDSDEPPKHPATGRRLLSIHQSPGCLLVTFPQSCSNLAVGESHPARGGAPLGSVWRDHWSKMRSKLFAIFLHHLVAI